MIRPEKYSVSVIVPFYNEAENATPVCEELISVLKSNFKTWEILAINDGSHDGTIDKLMALARKEKNLKVIDFVRNFGQTSAMMAGIDHAQYDLLVGMDGDGQNDPAAIPLLVQKLDEGFDVVSGWREKRKDSFLRTLPSQIANGMISKFGGVPLHDYGCSLKVYKRAYIKPIRLYGEMHRFIPIYTSWQGGRIAELPVNHRARERGASKYGFNRIFKVLLDMMLIKFLQKYLAKPIYVFGGLGFVSFGLAGATALWAILRKIGGTSFIATPLPTIFVMFTVMGALSILLGLLAEIIVRTYHESQQMKPYQIRRQYNFDEKTPAGGQS